MEDKTKQHTQNNNQPTTGQNINDQGQKGGQATQQNPDIQDPDIQSDEDLGDLDYDDTLEMDDDLTGDVGDKEDKK
jgi:hypothetical protein